MDTHLEVAGLNISFAATVEKKGIHIKNVRRKQKTLNVCAA